MFIIFDSNGKVPFIPESEGSSVLSLIYPRVGCLDSDSLVAAAAWSRQFHVVSVCSLLTCSVPDFAFSLL